MRQSFIFAAAILLAQSVAQAYGLPDDLAGKKPDELCQLLRSRQIPETDRPSPTQSKRMKNCDAMELYDRAEESQSAGDWKKARICAVNTSDRAVLSMLYANGDGVKQDIPLAVGLLCGVAGTALEERSLIENLTKERNEEDAYRFDVCEEYASGYSYARCSIRFEKMETREYDTEIGKIRQRFSSVDLVAFRILYAHLIVFAQNRMTRETFVVFSNQVSKAVDARRDEKRDFFALLTLLENKAALPVDGLEQSDEAVELAYRKLLNAKTDGDPATDELGDTRISKADFVESHRSWREYQTAWIDFARTRYPNLAQKSLKNYLAKQRLSELNILLGE